MADANKILKNELPRIHIEKSGRNLGIDVDRFAVDLAKVLK